MSISSAFEDHRQFFPDDEPSDRPRRWALAKAARVSVTKLGSLWRPLLTASLLATALASCGSTEQGASNFDTPFFDAWVSAWSEADPYEMVRFYSPDVAIELAQPDLELTAPAAFTDTITEGEGRAWYAGWIPAHIDTRDRELWGLFVDRESAVAVLVDDEIGAPFLNELRMDGQVIGSQSTLRWRDAHKPGGSPDERLEGVDTLADSYLALWSGSEGITLEDLYWEDAVLDTAETGRLTGRDEIEAKEANLALPAGSAARIKAGENSGNAIFVVPGPETRKLSFVVDSESSDGCSDRIAVVASIRDDKIVSERRLRDTATPRRCLGSELTWFAVMPVPPPVEEQVTGSVEHPSGYEVPLVNGTGELERFLDWGFSRFTGAGLEAPLVGSVSFAPVPGCSDVPGRVVEGADGTTADVVLCTDSYAVCKPNRRFCSSFGIPERFSLLHELAHVWMLDSLDDATRTAFLDAAGLETWRDGAVPWQRRGVERAADTIAWGLMDTPVSLVRFGEPPCKDVASQFEIVTGLPSPRECE